MSGKRVLIAPGAHCVETWLRAQILESIPVGLNSNCDTYTLKNVGQSSVFSSKIGGINIYVTELNEIIYMKCLVRTDQKMVAVLGGNA